MSFISSVIISSSLLVLLSVKLVLANWDPATGHLHNYGPSQHWISQHKKGQSCYNAIQVSECAQNTRLAYPNVQLFATFQVDHSDDNYHGCPYGTCCAYTQLPSPSDMEADFTNHHSFFWHGLGGQPGPGTNPIANPQTGGLGTRVVMGSFTKANRTSPYNKRVTILIILALNYHTPGLESTILDLNRLNLNVEQLAERIWTLDRFVEAMEITNLPRLALTRLHQPVSFRTILLAA
ncbi:hypothetical protein H4Q26_017183 [Puccinia striiformis f. sp. tritici PST-130]|nr:hypothetical protein H4Q26_017183 [Puccinia striiformis f. sp. tritici PST-130]